MTRALEIDSPRRGAVKNLLPHYQAMARAVAFGGARSADLAIRFGMTPQAIYLIVNSNLFKAEVARLQKQLEEGAIDVQRELLLRTPRAIEIIDEELWQTERSAARTKAAFEILDRTGYSKQKDPSKTGDTYNIVYLTPLPGESPVEAKKRIERLQKERALAEKFQEAEIIPEDLELPDEKPEEISPAELGNILGEE